MSLMSYLLEYNRYMNLLGIFVILFIAFLFSKKRKDINYKLVINALVLQCVIGFAILRTELGRLFVGKVAAVIEGLYHFAGAGIGFVFGSLSNAEGPWGVVFAIKILPIIIFFGAFMSLLFHLGIVQLIVYIISYCMRPILGTSGAETLCAISNSFLGQTEAPLLVKPYLKNMTKSEMLVVMVSGMATISGALLAVFASMNVPAVHLLTASVMSIPASLLIAKILLPETEKAQTAGGSNIEFEHTTSNVIDAVSAGTSDGLYLALNVGAMLISFLSLLALINFLLGWGTGHINDFLSVLGVSWQLPLLNLNLIFSYLFAPFGYLLGLTGVEALKAGALLGTKVAVNEFIAFTELVSMQLSTRAEALLTYALCGFSNFSCIGIQVGGIGALVPEKRAWLCELGLYAVLGGALSNLLNAMIAGLLL